MKHPAELRRHDLHPAPVVDGRPADRPGRRWQRRVDRLLVSRAERDEAQLERQLAEQPALSRANVVPSSPPREGSARRPAPSRSATCSPTARAYERSPSTPTPTSAPWQPSLPTAARSERTLADLLADIEQIHTAADLRSYVSILPSGLHLLGAPFDAQLMARLGPDSYGELIALLATFYELVLLDLGTGVAGELAQFAIGRADQIVLVTTPEWVAGSAVIAALEHLEHERTTVACNKFHARGPGDMRALERRLQERRLHRSHAIPYDRQLAAMLDTATYQLDALERTTRTAIKQLGLNIHEQLV